MLYPCVYIHTHTPLCVYICVLIHAYVCIDIYGYVLCACMGMYKYIYLCVFIIYVCINMCEYIYIIYIFPRALNPNPGIFFWSISAGGRLFCPHVSSNSCSTLYSIPINDPWRQTSVPDRNHERSAFMITWTILRHPQFAMRKCTSSFFFAAIECCHTSVRALLYHTVIYVLHIFLFH